MGTIDASRLLRPGLLEGVCMLVAGGSAADEGRERMGEAVLSACAGLGAQLARCMPIAGATHEQQEAAIDDAVQGALGEMPRIDILIVDAGALLADPGSRHSSSVGGGELGVDRSARPHAGVELGFCLQAVWCVTRSVFNLAFLPGERGGRIVYLAPSADAGEHAGPALAGLENLSRTLSIEWARHGVTALTVAPDRLTPADEAAALAAYLASPAGAYFSGCLLDLRGPTAAR